MTLAREGSVSPGPGLRSRPAGDCSSPWAGGSTAPSHARPASWSWTRRPLSPETLAGDRIDALAAKYPLHDELRARLESDASLPAEVRAAVPRVLAARVESVSGLRAVPFSPRGDRTDRSAEYERALRHAEAAARQRPDDPGVLAALGMALVRLDRDAPRALAALTRAAAPEWASPRRWPSWRSSKIGSADAARPCRAWTVS